MFRIQLAKFDNLTTKLCFIIRKLYFIKNTIRYGILIKLICTYIIISYLKLNNQTVVNTYWNSSVTTVISTFEIEWRILLYRYSIIMCAVQCGASDVLGLQLRRMHGKLNFATVIMLLRRRNFAIKFFSCALHVLFTMLCFRIK